MSIAQQDQVVTASLSDELVVVPGRLTSPAWLLDDSGFELWRNGFANGAPTASAIRLPVERAGTHALTLCLGHETDDSDRALERMVAHESRHRARNIVAIAIAIANQSFGPGPLAPAIRAFIDRLRSLDAVADVGCDVAGDRCPLRLVIERVTRRFDDSAKRFDLAGPYLMIARRWALLITLVLHELSANAIRHGALRGRDGDVKVRWHLDPAVSDDTRLTVSWRERGSSPLPLKNRDGFGMKLLCDVVAAASRCVAEARFRPNGLDYSLTIRLPSTDFALEA